MKRIAAILLVAGLGTGCATTGTTKSDTKPFNSVSQGKVIPGVVGPTGEPVMVAAKKSSGVMQASATSIADGSVQQASGFSRVIGAGHKSDCDSCGGGVHTPGLFAGRGNCASGNCGDMGPGFNGGYGRGIIPAPPMGPPGAVAAIGAIGPGMGMQQYSNMRTAIRFLGNGRITWYANGTYAEPGLSLPAEYNFSQANIYRLRLSSIANRPGKTYYPTLEVFAATPKSLTYLDHGTVPVSFTDEDLTRVDSGNLVIKVIYLPDSLYQDVTAIGGAEEIVSTQLEPGTDPIVEANRRGTILAVIRLGNINLENPNSPAKDAPPVGGPMMMPSAPPQMMPSTPPPVSMAPAQMPSMNITVPSTMLK